MNAVDARCQTPRQCIYDRNLRTDITNDKGFQVFLWTELVAGIRTHHHHSLAGVTVTLCQDAEVGTYSTWLTILISRRMYHHVGGKLESQLVQVFAVNFFLLQEECIAWRHNLTTL